MILSEINSIFCPSTGSKIYDTVFGYICFMGIYVLNMYLRIDIQKTVPYILTASRRANMLFISDKIINDHNKKVNDRNKNIFSCHLS